MENLSHIFIEAGTLMLAGMVFVFAFLGLLIVFVNTVLAQLAKKYPDSIAQSTRQRVTNNQKQTVTGMSPSIVAAISSAVTKYRQQHHNK